jgi:SAM-dependent methyltransferase
MKENRRNRATIFPESRVAHQWIDHLEDEGRRGVEFGTASHNPFGFKNCIFADREAPVETSPYYIEQMRLAGKVAPTHLIAELGKPLPRDAFGNESFDYIVTSHVLEHVWDLLGCFEEMHRILKPCGCMVHILPHKERMFDQDRPLATWAELVERRRHPENNPNEDDHHSVFDTAQFLAVLENITIFKMLDYLDTDDKVGNGFWSCCKRFKYDTARTIGQARSYFAYDSVNFR